MDIRNLRYFVEIVEQGSMKRAAESLYVAQPALSQQVKKLEEELGVKLLLRSVRGVAPTAAGEQLLHHARRILEQMNDARLSVQAGPHEPHGSVVLGLPSSISAALSVPLILRMQSVLPKVTLRVVEGTSGFVLEWLRAGQIDLCVLHGVQREPGVTAEPLLHEELYLIESARAPTRKRSVRFAEVAAMNLILPGRHHGLRDLLDRIAEEHDLKLAPIVEIDAFTQMKALAKLGLGNTILSRAAVAEEVQRGELNAVGIRSPRIERHMYLARASNRTPSQAVRAITDLLKDCAAAFDGEYWRMVRP